MLVREHGKKRYQHFLYSVNHLNRRKSPSAPHVSQEIETDFRSSSSFFFQKSREVPEVTDFSIVCGVGGCWLRKFARVGGVRSAREFVWSRCLRNMGVEGGRETNPIFVFLFFLLLGFPRRLPFFRAQQETNSQPKQPILKTKNIRYAFSTIATSHSMRLFREIHDVSYKICRRCSLLSFFLANPIVI